LNTPKQLLTALEILELDSWRLCRRRAAPLLFVLQVFLQQSGDSHIVTRLAQDPSWLPALLNSHVVPCIQSIRFAKQILRLHEALRRKLRTAMSCL